jgi:hypothetical protein
MRHAKHVLMFNIGEQYILYGLYDLLDDELMTSDLFSIHYTLHTGQSYRRRIMLV